MILKPTVLVLGAGASKAYGFPSGQELVTRIADEMQSGASSGPRQLIADASGSDFETVGQFRKQLLRARRRSIDAFIESRDQDYGEIGRCAIAQHLLRLENDEALFPSVDDWYTTFIDAILGNSPDAFEKNQLKIITFNFDRSFERALFLALETNFPGNDTQDLIDVVPVLHIHGDLGLPRWEPRHRNDAQAREYEVAMDPGSVHAAASRIRIVHQPVADDTLNQASSWLHWAERVFFLGFSYNELNLRKLGIPQTLVGKEQVVGTRLGIGQGPLNRVIRFCEGTIQFREEHNSAIMRVFDQFDCFYE